MDETLRVKIVAETTQATSSMKQLNKETQGLGQGSAAATQAVDKLDKALNSVGFKAIKLKAVSDGFKGISSSIKQTIKGTTELIGKIGTGFSKLKDTRFNFSVNDSLGKSLKTAHDYMNQLEKKAPEAAKKINDVFKTINEAKKTANNSNQFVDMSGLKKVREAVENLFKSRNKYIKETFKDADFDGIKQGLLNAAKAGAKGAKKEYKEALQGVMNALSKSTEKSTLTSMLDTFQTKAKFVISDVVAIAKKGIAAVGKALAAVGKGLLVGGAITALLAGIAAIKNAFNVSELGDSIDKTSQKVGMSTNAFQKWGYVLERCGLEVSQLQTATRALTRNSMNGNADYFKQLGIDPKGLSQQQLFDKTVTALQNISDSTQRARIAYKLFGQSSAELAPLLAISNAEVQRLTYQYDLLGAVMSGKVVRASVDLQDALTDMRAAFQGLKNTLAQAIIPLLTKVVVRITVFIAKINMILQALFGINIEYSDVVQSTETVTKNTNKTVAAVKKLKTLISGFDELNIFPSKDNGADLGGMLDDLADYGSDITPELGNILPPEAIAELENFRDNILPGIIEKFEKLKKIWETIKNAFNIKNWAQAFNDFLDNTKIGGKSIREIWEGVKEVFSNIWGSLSSGASNIWNSIAGAASDVWERIKESFSAIGETISSIFKPIGEKIGEFWEGAIKPIWDDIFSRAKNIGDNIFSIFSDVLDFFKGIGDEIWSFFLSVWDGIIGLFKDNQETFSQIGTFIGNVLGAIGTAVSAVVDGIAIAIDWVVQKVKNIWDLLKPFVQPIIDFLKVTIVGAINGVKDFVFSVIDAIVKLIGAFVAVLNGDFSGAADLAKKAFERMGQFIMNTWNGIKNWFATYVKPVFTKAYWDNKLAAVGTALSSLPIVQKAKELWASVTTWWNTNIAPKFTKDYWKQKWNIIKDGLGYSSILTSIQDKWKSVVSWWSNTVAAKFTWTYWRDKFNTIKTGLQNISLVDAGKKMINGLIGAIESGINWIIRKINNSGIVDALRKVGINISLNEIYIPRLAKGGIIDKPTVAMMGEYPGAKSNPEIVTPETKLTEVFNTSLDGVTDVFIQCTRQIIEAIVENQPEVNIDGKTILKSVSNANNVYKLQTGQSLI